MLNRVYNLFYGETSVVHRINSVVKLLGLFVYVLLCFLKLDRVLFVCSLSFVFLLMLLSNVKMERYLSVVWKIKYIIILLYVVMYYMQMELVDMNIIVFKFVFLILYLSMIVFTTTREDIGKGCSILVNIFNVVGLSIKGISMYITNIFVFVDYFKESYRNIVTNNEMMGMVFSNSNAIDKIRLLISNFKVILEDTKGKMTKRKCDMKYRLYNDKVRCKYKYRSKLFVFDYIYVIINVAMVVFYILKVR